MVFLYTEAIVFRNSNDIVSNPTRQTFSYDIVEKLNNLKLQKDKEYMGDGLET